MNPLSPDNCLESRSFPDSEILCKYGCDRGPQQLTTYLFAQICCSLDLGEVEKHFL